MGKLGDMLNKDVGSLVKDAGKVLNADVGQIVKGAGKVLNTDLGTLMRGKNGAEPDPPTTVAGTMPKPRAGNPAGIPAANAAERGPPTSPGAKPKPASTRLSEELVLRTKRAEPSSQNIGMLLPTNVGDFSRPADGPVGKLASDPVIATYSFGNETLRVEVGLYWDKEEALQRVAELRKQCGAASREAEDGTWMVGKNDKGVTFAWVRECYVYAANTPGDGSVLIRFLEAFPY